MPEVSSQITAVSVYTDRARVTRLGLATVEPGARRLEFTGLPRALDPASVRASARGTARARLLGVDVRPAFYTAAPAARVRELEERLAALDGEERVLTDEADTLGQQIAYVDGLAGAARVQAAGLAGGRTTLAAQQELLTWITRTRSAALERLRAIDGERRGIAARRQQAQAELDQMRSARPRQGHTAVVEIEVTAAGDLGVELTYLITGAAWTPMYDLRLIEDGVEVTYLGEVSQSTGEDWTGVNLSLSTAMPALAPVLPELPPWYITPYAPTPPPMPAPYAAPGAYGPPPPGATVMVPRAIAAEAAAPVFEAEVATATVSESGAALTFRVGGSVDVPGDGGPRKLTIGSFKLPHGLDYITAPRRAAAAYRRVRATNISPYTLLPGRAQLFEADDYLGATSIEQTAAGQELLLYFGADERMRVERELTRRDVDRRFLGDRRRINYAYRITVENHTGAARSVVVQDQTPVARHEEIKVKVEATEPRPASIDDLNRIEWQIELPDGGKARIAYEFTVEHPRALIVSGLP